MTKVAAFQAPLLESGSALSVAHIRERVEVCEDRGVQFLCCPEAILGGLADYAPAPTQIAYSVKSGKLHRALSPLASKRVTSIVGFTEIDDYHQLYNCAAVFHDGSIVGLYRKQHTAINKSVYSRGDHAPVFTIGALTFGIMICRDSVFDEPARAMAAKGATVLFVPTNNGLPPGKSGPEIVQEVRHCDTRHATQNHVYVVRADVAGTTSTLASYGCSAIIDPTGRVLAESRPMQPDLIVADIGTTR